MNTPRSPYKGLSAFGDSALDAMLFFGRERERDLVIANMTASRLTVLYGPAGVGKSSLLNAGVARSLREDPETRRVAVFNSWIDDRTDELRAAVAEAAERVRLHDSRPGRGVLPLPPRHRPFGSELAELGTARCASTSSSPCARTHSRSSTLQGLVPNLLGNYLRLDHLDRESARAASSVRSAPSRRYRRVT